MTFFITTLDQQSDYRHFHLDNPELEAGFDVLDRIVAQGNRLLRATLIDGSSSIRLPVDAFDGQPCQAALHALEQEWCELLDIPINKKD